MDDKTSYEHSILLVDDETSILKAMTRLLRKTPYTIHISNSGQEALDLLAALDKKISMIISDQKMPGMSGSEFLEKSRQYVPDAVRFLLTGYSDMETLVDAINKGGVQRYISKPWNDNDLLLTIEHGLRQYELVLENRRLMEVTKKQNAQLLQVGRLLDAKVKQRTTELKEKTQELEDSFYNIIRSFSALTDTFFPEDSGHGRRVSALANEIARKAGVEGEELRNIEIASLLHDIGKIGTSKSLVSPFQEHMSPSEKAKYIKHSMEGFLILRFIPQLDKVSLYIKSHHENYDGSGFPEGLSEDEIPLGSRIIAVADAYDRIAGKPEKNENPVIQEYERATGRTSDHVEQSEMAHQAAIYYLKQNAFSLFDPNIIKILLEILKTQGFTFQEEKKMQLEKLEPGMVLTRPLYTVKGRFLLPYNTTLTASVISKLISMNDSDPIQEPVYAATY